MQEEEGIKLVERTLVMEDELSERTVVRKVLLRRVGEQLLLLDWVREEFANFQEKIVRVYDYSKGVYVVVGSECLVPCDWVEGEGCGVVLVKVGEVVSRAASNCSSTSHGEEVRSQSSSTKKERSKERVIFEVIEIVKRWREIHLRPNNLKKVSLQQAAKLVGLPKKSLDDYYYQLRLGQKYGFDFESHLFDRIGVLRTYLKNIKDQSGFDKHEKHPKKLRIIDQFDSLSELFYRQEGYGRVREGLMEEEVEYGRGEGMDERGLQEAFDEVNHFKSEFQYLLDEKDPFLAGDYDFKKKHMDDSNMEEIFF